MGARGVAITFVSREEGKELTAVEALINREVPQRDVGGFVSHAPKEEETPRPASRLEAPVEVGAPQPPARTLAAKFPTRRSRRRR
jgi:superfamily II DNA/RNA helicase